MDLILQNAIRKDGPFIISSGQEVDEYIDMYQVILHPLRLEEISNRLLQKFLGRRYNGRSIQFVAGRETAGALLAITLSSRLRVPSLVVRDKERDHGTLSRIEKPYGCDFYIKNGYKNVVLIDDVTSTGVGMRDSIEKLRAEDFNPILAYSIVYRGLGAHKVAQELGIPFEYLFYHPEEPIN